MINGQTRQNILVDTSIPLEGGEDIIAKLDKVAPVFVTDIVLQELDGHKNNANGAIAYQAREFFRRLGKTNGEALFVLPPDGMKLEKTDTLRRMTLGNTTLHVIVRKPYKSRDINDSKIIEVAKDYNMTLVTLDMAQRVRAMSEGVNVETLKVEEKKVHKMTIISLFIAFWSILFFVFYYFAQNIIQYKSIGEVIGISMFLLVGVGFTSVLPYYFINKDKFENNTSYTKELNQEKFDDWQTNPSDNLLIGNTFHDSLND